MSDKDRPNETPNQQDVKLEDLPVEEETQDEVKGGPGFIYASSSG